MYEDGEGCEFDFAKAAELFHQAALSNHPHAHFNLGCLLEKGKGVEQNHSAARSHLQKVGYRTYTYTFSWLASFVGHGVGISEC